MDACLYWLIQGGEDANFIDVTFIRDGLALTNLVPPNQPEVLKKNGIRSILSLFEPSEQDLEGHPDRQGSTPRLQ